MKDITGNTKVFGILADPIHHVKTPQRINSYLNAEGFDGVMIPIHVSSNELKVVVHGLRAINNLAGFVVTVPHKTAMVDLCDDLTAEARLIGAVNVIHRMQDGRLLGTMLDGEGFVAGLRAEGIDLQGLSAYVAGAGGAASAICFALVRAGVKRLTITNRTTDKVVQLIERIQTMRPSVELSIGSPDASGNDLVVNATSLGLRFDDALPLDVLLLKPNQVVAEIIMQPVETPLLKAAAAKGCRIHFGAPMLTSQIPLMSNFMRYGHIEGANNAA